MMRLSGNNLTRVMLTGVLLLMSVDTLRADEPKSSLDTTNSASEERSVLGGKRLFFDQSERSSHTENNVAPSRTELDVLARRVPRIDPQIGSGANATNGTSAVPSGTMAMQTAEPELPSVPALGIHYQARIRSSNAIRIIINGLPCESINLEMLQSTSSEDTLSCIALDAHSYQLSLLADTESVEVRRSGRVLGTLTLGDRL